MDEVVVVVVELEVSLFLRNSHLHLFERKKEVVDWLN